MGCVDVLQCVFRSKNESLVGYDISKIIKVLFEHDLETDFINLYTAMENSVELLFQVLDISVMLARTPF